MQTSRPGRYDRLASRAVAVEGPGELAAEAVAARGAQALELAVEPARSDGIEAEAQLMLSDD